MTKKIKTISLWQVTHLGTYCVWLTDGQITWMRKYKKRSN